MFLSLLLQNGHTCGDHCWHAKELQCRCSCGGVNHGILTKKDGKQPVRTCKINGNFYELVSIVAANPQECAVVNQRKGDNEFRRVCDERFPGLNWMGYGEWREEKTMPVVNRAISES